MSNAKSESNQGQWMLALLAGEHAASPRPPRERQKLVRISLLL
jgi:hypothetical protein